MLKYMYIAKIMLKLIFCCDLLHNFFKFCKADTQQSYRRTQTMALSGYLAWVIKKYFSHLNHLYYWIDYPQVRNRSDWDYIVLRVIKLPQSHRVNENTQIPSHQCDLDVLAIV